VLSTQFTDQEDRMTIDMTDAYQVPALVQLLRTNIYSRQGKGSVTISDAFKVKESRAVEEAIITRGTWKQVDGSNLEFSTGNETVHAQIKAPASDVSEVNWQVANHPSVPMPPSGWQSRALEPAPRGRPFNAGIEIFSALSFYGCVAAFTAAEAGV
jgi:hypothetical protein